MPPIKTLAFDHEGMPRMLSSLEEIERAITRGDLGAQTPVTVFFDGHAPRFAPAADHPQLARYFLSEEPLPPVIELAPTVPMAEPVAVEEVAPSPDPAAAGVPETEAARTPETDAAGAPEPAPMAAATPSSSPPEQAAKGIDALFETPPVRRSTGSSRGEAWRGGGFVLLLVIGVLALGRCGATAPNTGDTSGNMMMKSAEAVATPAPDIQTYYLVRKSPARSIASRDGRQLGLLERGTEVRGYLVPGARDAETQWVHIKQGAYVDGFVSRVNIGTAPPAPIDASSAGAFFLLRDSGLLDAPNGTARRQLALGTPVEVVGTVGGFAEVTDKAGGVGYMNWSDITGDPYSTARYALTIANRCLTEKLLLLTWHQDGAWRTAADQRYTINAGITTPLIYQHGSDAAENVIIDRPEVYYYPLSPSMGNQIPIVVTAKDMAVIDGKAVTMIAAIPALTVSDGGTGTATVTFDGKACLARD